MKRVLAIAASLGLASAIKQGDMLPNIGLDQGFPPEKVMMGDFCKDKTFVLVGLPGAFTPT